MDWELLEYVGEALVFIGVVGEVFAEWREPHRKRLAKASSLVLIIGLGLALAALKGTNEGFKTTIANLRKEASDADLEAAQLRLKAEELEEQILEQGPRDLMLYGKREDIFVNGLRQFKGQKVQVRICVFGNNEVRDTAERLTAVFKLAEWNVSPGSPNWGETNCPLISPESLTVATGIWVGMPNPNPTAVTKERAKKLLALLKAIPLEAAPHALRPDTGRKGPSQTTIQGRYDDPDGIVVTIVGHPSGEAPRASASISVIAIGP